MPINIELKKLRNLKRRDVLIAANVALLTIFAFLLVYTGHKNSQNNPIDIAAANLEDLAWEATWFTEPGTSPFVQYASEHVIVGNRIFITGTFRNTVDFNPDPSETNTLTAGGSTDVFVVAYTTGGDYLWSTQIGSTTDSNGREQATSIAGDSNGVYVSGHFQDTVDFDPGAGVVNRTATGTGTGAIVEDTFIVSYDLDGNFRWVNNYSYSNSNYDGGISIREVAVLPNGNVAVGGNVIGDSNFGGGPFSLGVNEYGEAFFLVLDSNGNYVNDLVLLEATALETVDMMEADSGNNIYASGHWSSATLTLGTDSYTKNGASYDVFVIKFDQNLNILWTDAFGGTGYENFEGIGVNSSYVYLSGDFNSTLNLGVATLNFVGAGTYDTFVIKYDASGNRQTAFSVPTGTNINWDSIELVDDGYYLMTTLQGFQGAVDFDPGPGTDFLSASDAHTLSFYDSSDNYQWTYPLNGATISTLSETSDGTLHLTGTFSGTVDFDPNDQYVYRTASGIALHYTKWRVADWPTITYGLATLTANDGIDEINLDIDLGTGNPTNLYVRRVTGTCTSTRMPSINDHTVADITITNPAVTHYEVTDTSVSADTDYCYAVFSSDGTYGLITAVDYGVTPNYDDGFVYDSAQMPLLPDVVATDSKSYIQITLTVPNDTSLTRFYLRRVDGACSATNFPESHTDGDYVVNWFLSNPTPGSVRTTIDYGASADTEYCYAAFSENAYAVNTIFSYGVDNNYDTGIAVHNIPEILGYTVVPWTDEFREVNIETGETLSNTTMTLAGETIEGALALVAHPLTCELWTIIKVDDGMGHYDMKLATIDPDTGVVTFVGDFNDKFANIAFTDDGTLYGVTGEMAANPEALYRIDPSDMSTTLVSALGSGDDGESIIPFQNRLYHFSGWGYGSVVMEELITNPYSNTPIGFSPASPHDPGNIAGGFYWRSRGMILGASPYTDSLYNISTDGTSELRSILDHSPKGIVIPSACHLAPQPITHITATDNLNAGVTVTITVPSDDTIHQIELRRTDGACNNSNLPQSHSDGTFIATFTATGDAFAPGTDISYVDTNVAANEDYCYAAFPKNFSVLNDGWNDTITFGSTTNYDTGSQSVATDDYTIDEPTTTTTSSESTVETTTEEIDEVPETGETIQTTISFTTTVEIEEPPEDNVEHERILFVTLTLITVGNIALAMSGNGLISASFGLSFGKAFPYAIWKRYKNPWGIIYDERTHKPIPFAVVRLFQDGQLIQNIVSDTGGRYSFSVEYGNYTLEVDHSDYKKIRKDLSIQGQVVVEDVPMKPMSNKRLLYRLNSSHKIRKMIKIANKYIFVAGFVIAVASLAQYPNILLWIINGIYLFFGTLYLYRYLRTRKMHGKVMTINEEPVPGAAARLLLEDSVLDVLSTNADGLFNYAIHSGKFKSIYVSKPGYKIPAESELSRYDLETRGYLVNVMKFSQRALRNGKLKIIAEKVADAGTPFGSSS